MKKLKKYLTGLLALILVISPLSPLVSKATGDSAPEIKMVESLENGDFEESVIGGDVTGWTLVSTDIAGAYDTSRDFTGNYRLAIVDDAFDGDKALAFSGVNGTKGYVVAESDGIKVTAGKGYAISYALKIQNAEEGNFYGGRVYVNSFDANGNLIAREQVGGDYQSNMDWRKFTASITAKENVAYVRLAFYIGGVWQKNIGIQMLIDQISFVQSDDVEDEPVEEDTALIKLDALTNGGFEESVFNRPVSGWSLATTNTAGGYDDSRDFTGNYQLAVTDDAARISVATISPVSSSLTAFMMYGSPDKTSPTASSSSTISSSSSSVSSSGIANDTFTPPERTSSILRYCEHDTKSITVAAIPTIILKHIYKRHHDIIRSCKPGCSAINCNPACRT